MHLVYNENEISCIESKLCHTCWFICCVFLFTGMAEVDLGHNLNDQKRIDYLQSHLAALQDSVEYESTCNFISFTFLHYCHRLHVAHAWPMQVGSKCEGLLPLVSAGQLRMVLRLHPTLRHRLCGPQRWLQALHEAVSQVVQKLHRCEW